MNEADEARINDVVSSMDDTPESSTGTKDDKESVESSTAQASHEADGKVPWHQDRRWQKWQSEEKSLRQKAEMLDKNSQAIEWFHALSRDPSKFEAVKNILIQQQQSNKEDPYAAYDPDVAGKFKQVDEVTNKISQLEQRLYQSQAERNVDVLDNHFQSFCNEKKLAGEEVQKNLAALTFVNLQQILGPQNDLRLATLEQVNEALESAYSQIDAVGKWYVNGSSGGGKTQKIVVPPSGSNHGVPPRQDRLVEDSDRIRELMSMM